MDSTCDAIGRPVNIGDYVTAVWACGDVALFKVKGFKQKRRRYRVDERMVTLERVFDGGSSTVVKSTSQITWVDPDWVIMHLLNR